MAASFRSCGRPGVAVSRRHAEVVRAAPGRALESSLIGSSKSSCPVEPFLRFVSFAWVTRFSSRSAQGRRMMGSVRQGVSICFTTLQAMPHRLETSQRNRLALRPHGNDLLSLSANCSRARSFHLLRPLRDKASCRAPCRNGTPFRRSTYDPVRRQSLRATATRARAMPRCLAIFMPSPQGRSLAAAHEQRVGRLVQCRAREFVAAPADLPWMSVSPDW